jgi:4-hydroxy-4-methyl-2-oxoglutarate aldolase
MDEPFELRKLYQYLRVADVCDALDGIGYFDLTLMASEIRPLWAGMKFWGVALTVRCVPANRPMWKLNTTEEVVAAHGIWFKEMGNIGFADRVQPGNVVVTDTGGAREVGFFGSENALNLVGRGAVGIITNGCCRDTAELEIQKTPICCRARGRTIIPGRIEVADVETKIGCGGVQVRAGDIVGCDDDGIVVVPAEVALEVAIHARAVLLADMGGGRKHYERLGMPLDATVDHVAVERYHAELEAPGTGAGGG